jgi:hypothetical protein
MNLIQIQEHLKDMPTQAIMAYANGQNPEVPPYMALGEMNRRKNMEQRAAQAPNASVKDQLESELNQQLALPGIGQGMNMRINPAGMPQPVPAAQPQMAPQMPKMANPPLARSLPPQQLAQPGSIPAGAPGMAGGGLAQLPVGDMFHYAPGGIVAFANPENNQVVPTAAADEAVASGGAAPEGDQGLPTALANTLLRQRLMGNAGIPIPEDPEEIRKRYIAEHPEQAKLLNALPGETLTKLAGALEEQNKSQRERFQQGEGTRGLAALSNALIAAGEATRGQRGMGLGAAFGGFGKSYNASTVEAEDRAAKQQAAERAQTVETMKLQSDIEGLQRAYAEGNIAKIAEYKKSIQARQEKIAAIQGSAAKEVLDLEDKLKQRSAQEARYKGQEAHENRMYEQAKRSADIAASSKPSAEDKKIALAMARAQGDSVIKTLAKQASEAVSDDEYQSILRKIEAREAAIYKDAGVKNAPTETKSTVMTAVNDKNETITSTDGGVTWKDAKGKIVK